MKSKIAILGAGSAGIQAAAHFCAYLNKHEWEVSLIYDPSVPIFGIGESTNGTFVDVLGVGLKFNFLTDLEKIDGTLKFGTKYINWRDTELSMPLISGNTAVHFNTFKLKEFAIPRLHEVWGDKFKEVHGNVTDIDNGKDFVTLTIDGVEQRYDFVMDARGTPKDFTDYWVLQNQAFNHALVHNIPGDGSKWGYTAHVATVDGWMFQVPLTTRISHGYLFDDTITPVEEAKSNFSKLINVPEEQLDKIEYKFKPYYAKQVLENRVIKNGNNAMFFEPMFGNSLWNYDVVDKLFTDYITGKISEDEVNDRFLQHGSQVKDFFYFKYHGGSKHDSPFWKKTAAISKEKLLESLTFHRTVSRMRKLNEEDSSQGHWWVFGRAGLNMIDRLFGYNYFKVD